MSWDRKECGHSYYYRSIRNGSRVTKKYFGRGAEAKVAEQRDVASRRRKLKEKEHWDRVMGQTERARVETESLFNFANLMMRVVLVAHGHYCHKGHEWRRRGKMFHG